MNALPIGKRMKKWAFLRVGQCADPSWQIVPTALQDMLQDADGEKTNRVLEVLLTMKKLDIVALRRAYERA